MMPLRLKNTRNRAVAVLGLIALEVGTLTGNAFSAPRIAEQGYLLLHERMAAERASFYVYRDMDSGSNHGFPSGFFGTLGKVSLEAGCLDDPGVADGCSTDSSRLNTARGSVLRIAFAPLSPGQFAGVNFEEPEHWGAQPRGQGYDLRGATEVVFDVRTPSAQGVSVEFGVGGPGHTAGFIPITHEWTTKRIPLSSLNLSSGDLANVHILFSVGTNDAHAPAGATVLLDNVRFEPMPISRQAAVQFPLANQTFGVVPRAAPAPGRVPFPLDQVLRNVTTIYESALSLLVLLRRGTAPDLALARSIADAFVYALAHENRGDPLPQAPGGFLGLHNGYSSGDLALFNDQAPGAGRAGDVRLAGFSCAVSVSGFCIVLDGATGGNNAFAMLALVGAHRQFQDPRYLDAARGIGNWIVGNLTDTSETGYGGYHLGYPDEGVPPPKPLVQGKSVENNADIFAAFTVLAATEASLGHSAEAAAWTSRANVAGDFVMAMFDPVAGRFHAGTVPMGTAPGPGLCPNGPVRGGEVINTCDFLDSNTFTALAMATAPRYRDQIDWRRPIQYVLDTFSRSVSNAGTTFSGFNIVSQPAVGPDGIAWEFTAQAVAAMRWIDRRYGECRFAADADRYLNQLRLAQASAPFGDGRGLVASTLQNGAALPPLDQCLSTPFQCIAERVGLAATTWAILAEGNISPLGDVLPPLALTVNPASVRPTQTVTVDLEARLRGPALTADFYLGLLRPDGVTLCFVTALSPPALACVPRGSDPAAVPALARGIAVPQDLALTVEGLFTYVVSATDAQGPHSFFAVVTPAGALADHRVDSGDIRFADLQPVCVSP